MRKIPIFVDLRAFAIVGGEIIKCEGILTQNEMSGEITQYYF